MDILNPAVLVMALRVDAWVYWLVLMVIFLIAEIATVNLVTIWFVIGSLAAIAAALLGAGVWIQILIMLIVSGILLGIFLMIRPKLGLTDRKSIPTNADRYIGQSAVVIQAIDPVNGTGQIKSLGQVWSAVSADDTHIEEGVLTVITQIRGVKAVVRKQKQNEDMSEETKPITE